MVDVTAVQYKQSDLTQSVETALELGNYELHFVVLDRRRWRDSN